MKKLLVAVLALSVLFVGCEKVDNSKYKEGVYEGSVVDSYGGQENTATAKVTVDSDGKITEVFLDTTYTKNGVQTTKKALGDDYGMKAYSDAEYEWDEQVEALEQAVVEKQGIEFLNLDEDGFTDAVSKCTIKINALYEALEQALNKAAK